MTTATDVNALTVTQALMAELPGWVLSDTTTQNLRENDRVTRDWAELVNPAYPGAELTINTSRSPGRLEIRADYPSNWQPYIHDRGGRVYSESITVSATKAPAQIARDIQKRLFEATGYLTIIADCMRRKAESEQGYDAAEGLARELATIVGTTTAYDRYAKVDGRSDLKTDANRTRFSWHDSNYRTRVEGEVAHGGTGVKLTLSDLTPDQARRLLTVWKELQK